MVNFSNLKFEKEDESCPVESTSIRLPYNLHLDILFCQIRNTEYSRAAVRIEKKNIKNIKSLEILFVGLKSKCMCG